MKNMQLIGKFINLFFNFLYFNRISVLYFKFKIKIIHPRLDKVEGKILSGRIKHKGEDLRIHGRATITGIDNLYIGDYVRIGKGAYFGCEGGLSIGNNVQFSRNVLIYTNSHNIHSSAIPYDNTYIYKPVKIGNSVWIGMNVVIAPGTIIEDGAVIGMGTVVSGVIPKGAIVVSSKHRIIGTRDIEDFDKMNDEQKYFGLLYPDR